jgi:hypothetical protein
VTTDANPGSAGDPASLHLRVHLDQARLPAGRVVLANSGTREVRVWRTGNAWGDTALEFEVLHEARTWRIVREPQEYTRNVPSSVPIPPGGTHEWPFDLGDGQWQADAALDQVIVPGARLVAVYAAPPSAEAGEQHVWTGRLRSEPVTVE